MVALLLNLVAFDASAEVGFDMTVDCSKPEHLQGIDRGQCAGRALEGAKFVATKAYAQLLNEVDDSDTKKAIKAAHSSWKQYAETECHMFTQLQGFGPLGSMYGEVFADCMRSEYSTRARKLVNIIRVARESNNR